jgi:hypothetical protein
MEHIRYRRAGSARCSAPGTLSGRDRQPSPDHESFVSALTAAEAGGKA